VNFKSFVNLKDFIFLQLDLSIRPFQI